jgi:signal transduction histidine kinase
MRLWYKFCLAIIVVALTFAAIRQEVYNVYIVDRFSAIEHDDMMKRITSASYIFNNRVDTLASLSADWGVWDSAYEFAGSNASYFIEENLVENTFSNLDVNFILIFDQSFNLLYGAAYDLEAPSFVPLPVELLPGSERFPAPLLNLTAPVSGLVNINGSYAIFAGSPIMTSLDEGPSRGVFLFGRYVDQSLLVAMSDQLQLPVCAYNSNSGMPFSLDAMAIDGNGRGALALNESTIVAAALFPSMNSNDRMILTISCPRHIFAQGMQINSFFSYSNLIITAIFIVLAALISKTLIMTRIGRLDSMVERVTREGKKNNAIRISGDDELSRLASNVDAMAGALERSKDELRNYTTRLEDIVEERTAQLRDKERLAAIGETATMVGHDLRNPLQAIINTIYLMKGSIREYRQSARHDEVLMSLDRLERNAMYMNNIVSNLNEYARPAALNLSFTDVPALIKDALSSVQIPPEVVVRTELGPISAELDPIAMKRVLSNLIINSVQSMPRGGELTLRATSSNGQLIIEVGDHGVGISAEDQFNIFKPFFTKKSKGMGMGLPVTKKYVDLHGGTISVKSALGKGTTITLVLPLQHGPKSSDSS